MNIFLCCTCQIRGQGSHGEKKPCLHHVLTPRYTLFPAQCMLIQVLHILLQKIILAGRSSLGVASNESATQKVFTESVTKTVLAVAALPCAVEIPVRPAVFHQRILHFCSVKYAGRSFCRASFTSVSGYDCPHFTLI